MLRVNKIYPIQLSERERERERGRERKRDQVHWFRCSLWRERIFQTSYGITGVRAPIANLGFVSPTTLFVWQSLLVEPTTNLGFLFFSLPFSFIFSENKQPLISYFFYFLNQQIGLWSKQTIKLLINHDDEMEKRSQYLWLIRLCCFPNDVCFDLSLCLSKTPNLQVFLSNQTQRKG